MIKEHYPLTSNKKNNAFLFNSIGKKGTILKVIIFEDSAENRYNLAFGDAVNNQLDDKVITNNNDLIMVISTVVKAVYLFLEVHPNAIIEIDPVDEKRGLLYNRIFKRRYTEIIANYNIIGINDKLEEVYNPEKLYQEFEIHPKKL